MAWVPWETWVRPGPLPPLSASAYVCTNTACCLLLPTPAPDRPGFPVLIFTAIFVQRRYIAAIGQPCCELLVGPRRQVCLVPGEQATVSVSSIHRAEPQWRLGGRGSRVS
jgi:hypothetical protein